MKKTISFLLLLTVATVGRSQSQLHVFQDWAGTAGTQNFFYKNVTKTDNSNNVYVAGATINGSGTTDILVAKYNSAGVQQWVQQYNGLANYHDFATALVIDGSSNVYVTGAVSNDTLNPTANTDVILIKYNSSGVQQWVSTYAGAAGYFDSGTDLYVTSGGVGVVGSTMNAGFTMDYVTILYSTAGTQLWASIYNHSSNLHDVPVKISKRGSAIIVAGGVQTGPGTYDWAVVQYNTSGTQTGLTTSSGGSTAIDSVFDMMEDTNGNIYLAGSTSTLSDGFDFDLVKLDSNLVIQWEQTYDGAGLDDAIKGIKADAAGNVYVTGFTTTATQGTNYLTQKYSSAGTLTWSQPYNDSLNGDDEAHALVLDNTGEHLYVTGASYTDALNGINYYTIKYDTAGTQLWAIPYDGDKHMTDIATNIAIDTVGNVIVTGESQTAIGTYEYATVRYVEKQVVNPADFNSEPTPANFQYYANKGQLINTDSTLVPDVYFYTNSTYPAYYFKNDTMSMVFSIIDSIAGANDTLHRIDLSFPLCNEHLRIYPLEEQKAYMSYFYPQCPEGVTEIHGNQKLVVTDLYDNIDVVYSSNQNGIKCYFIVKPGGDPDDIRLQFSGASSTNLSSNILTINSSIGSIAFDRPFIYQLNSGNDTVPGSDGYADWHNNGSNNYDFDVHPYDSMKVFIIELDEGNSNSSFSINSIEWSTYFGRNGNDGMNDAKTDANAYLYICGITNSTLFPATAGTYQAANLGSFDAIASKFYPTGELSWSTYMGGGNTEGASGIAYDGSGNVFIVGETGSFNFPVIGGNPGSPAYYDNVNSSDATYTDGFIAKIASNGVTAPWRTYIGGAKGENLNAIKTDGSGNIFIVGQTSSSDFPLQSTGGAYTHACATGGAGADDDGVLIKFNSFLQKQWSTCYGTSSAFEPLNDLAIDPSGNIFAVGSTQSASFSLLSASAYWDNSFNGTSEATISKFNNNGVRSYATFYGGGGSESASSVVCDNAGGIYIGGYTGSNDLSTLSYGSPYGYYQSTKGSASFTPDAMLIKLSSGLVREWATYVGGTGDEYASSLTFDNHGVLYFSGTTASTNFPMPPTNPTNTYNQSYNGATDAFLMAFDVALENIWSTYLGGDNNDYAGATVVTDVNDKLFMIGRTESDATGTPFPLDNGGGPPVYFNNTYAAGEGCITRFDVSPTVFIGIDETIASENNLLLYPNPASNTLTISYSGKANSEVILKIFNMLGEAVKTIDCGKQSEPILRTFDISALSNGVYFVQVQDGEHTISKKFIKQ